MSNLTQFISIIFVCMCFACTHSTAIEKEECIDNLEMAKGFKPYDSEVLGCRFFIDQYECKGELLFVLNNHCADIIYKVIDCDNQDVTEKYGDKLHNKKAKIVAIKID